MKRRDFIAGLGVAALPFTARGQQSALPVIGFLGAGSAATFAGDVTGFRKGLSEAGFVEGRTLAIEFRWAEGRYDRLPALAAELVQRRVAVILASGGQLPTRAAQAATSSIPIVFTYGRDPVPEGLVASLTRPGGNVTGFSNNPPSIATKRLPDWATVGHSL